MVSRIATDNGPAPNSTMTRLHEPEGQPSDAWDIDKLTGVLNRWGWDEQAPRTLSDALSRREAVALLSVGIDSFWRVNDSLGHSHGDSFLRSVASVLREVAYRKDLIGRFGAGEFVLLLRLTDYDGAIRAARRIRERLRRITIPRARDIGTKHECSASVGIALSSSGRYADIDLDALLSEADAARLAAKRHGSDRTCVVHPWLGRDLDARLLFDPPLRDASRNARSTEVTWPSTRGRGAGVVG
jgi:diguanylate cyclase (GGDEF)-like protein